MADYDAPAQAQAVPAVFGAESMGTTLAGDYFFMIGVLSGYRPGYRCVRPGPARVGYGMLKAAGAAGS
jgi:hypothetical protein